MLTARVTEGELARLERGLTIAALARKLGFTARDTRHVELHGTRDPHTAYRFTFYTGAVREEAFLRPKLIEIPISYYRALADAARANDTTTAARCRATATTRKSKRQSARQR